MLPFLLGVFGRCLSGIRGLVVVFLVCAGVSACGGYIALAENFGIQHRHVFQFVHVHVSCLVCGVRLFFCCSRFSDLRVAMEFMFVCHHAVSVGPEH